MIDIKVLSKKKDNASSISGGGNIGGANINLTVIHIMKDVGFWMKRAIFLIVKTQVHPVTQLPLDQIQCRGLRDTEIISCQNSDPRSSIDRMIQFLQKHFHT